MESSIIVSISKKVSEEFVNSLRLLDLKIENLGEKEDVILLKISKI